MDPTLVQANLESMKKEFSSKLSELQAEIKQASRKNPGSIAALNSEFIAFKGFVCNGLSLLQQQVDAMAKSVGRLEMRTRRKMLLVHGVPEQKDEKPAARVVEVLSAKMSGSNLAESNIQTSYRLGKISNKKPRPIVVKFNECTVRDKLWKDKPTLEKSGVTLSEFLTKSRHSVFRAAREKYEVKNCWKRDGFIFIKTKDGEKHKVETMAEFLAIPAPTDKA